MAFMLPRSLTLPALCLLVSLMLSSVSPSPPGAGLSTLRGFTLDNGLQVVVIPDHGPGRVPTLVWYKSAPPTSRKARPASPTSSSS